LLGSMAISYAEITCPRNGTSFSQNAYFLNLA
jgi:hypothetical protein